MYTHLLLRILSFLIIFINPVIATFVHSQKCNNANSINDKLQPFIIDAALDEDKKKLKFFINTQVINNQLNTTNYDDVVISNYSQQTDLYTMLNVQIDFMGKLFINETNRFCDMISVKNTTSYQRGPRFENSTVESMYKNLTNFNQQSPSLNQQVILSDTNSTVESLFSHGVSCPLYYRDSVMIYYEADITDHFHKLGSYQILFQVFSNDQGQSVIGCSRSYVTPVQPKIISNIINYGVLVLIILTGATNFFTIAYSSYQESSNPFLFVASTICNKDLLKQYDTSVPQLLIYLQYALFLGGLDLSYPGFFQPMIYQIRWCALLGVAILNSYHEIYFIDNIYITLGGGGLTSLNANFENPVLESWPNFILSLLCLMILIIILTQIFVFSKLYIDKRFKTNGKLLDDQQRGFSLISKKNFYLIIGQMSTIFLKSFGIPFLIFTSFLFLSANDINGKHRSFATNRELHQEAYSFVTPYDELLIPSSVFTFGSSISIPVNHLMPPAIHSSHSPPTSIDKMNIDQSLAPWLSNSTTTSSPNDREKYMNISNACLIFASLFFAAYFILVFYFIFRYLVKKKSKLYTSLKTILLWATFYHLYKPNRIKYVFLDIFIMVSNSLIIGLLQSHGMIQVICLIILSSIELVTLFVYRPYFVQSWWSSNVMFPIAKFVIICLCIPLIRELQINESVRTYTVYTQLLIHALVAIIFTIQLIYWFSRTLITNFTKEKKNESDIIIEKNTQDATDSYDSGFEYQPVTNLKYFQPPPIYEESEVDSLDDSDYYYRYKSENLLNHRFGNAQTYERYNSETESFMEMVKESNFRKLNTDYKVREGDFIYKKYFIDDDIDPEVRELWERRQQKGFQVKRPKQLIVKKK